jgi:hypothetical protein
LLWHMSWNMLWNMLWDIWPAAGCFWPLSDWLYCCLLVAVAVVILQIMFAVAYVV